MIKDYTYSEWLDSMRTDGRVTEIPNIVSSNIKEVFFQEDENNEDDFPIFSLFTTFTSRNGDPTSYYIYDDVRIDDINRLLEANNTPGVSFGAVFNDVIKNGGYVYDKLDLLPEGD